MKEIINKATVKVDPGTGIGKIKPMHGVGQPPMTGLGDRFYGYLKRANIPYSRLHDVGGWMGGGLYVDVPNLFRDFDADENDPASYDFAFTDKILENLVRYGCEPYFRLGVTIENAHMVRSYRIFPPKDFDKWARICEHIVAHYNEGWANGYKMGITYWEIWNEPDDCFKESTSAMWKGTPEQYWELYSVTARRLKARFGDSIKVGGYGHCGLYEYAQDKDLEGIGKKPERIYEFVIEFFHGFLKYQRDTGAPLDFFSWHVYDNCHVSTEHSFRPIAQHAAYCRAMLDKYGFTKAEHHLNEWNLWTKAADRGAPQAAAKSLAFMLMMQDTSTDLMCYYDARVGGFSDYGGMFDPSTGYPYLNYYAFATFGELYRLKDQIKAESDLEELFAGAAFDGKKLVIALSNVSERRCEISLDLGGFGCSDCEIFLTDRENRRTLTGLTLSDPLVLSSYACAEIALRV